MTSFLLLLAAQQSGLLLGLSVSDGSTAAYRTLWIAPENGVVQVLASGPDLIVPRRDGFWRVCLVGGTTVEQGQLLTADTIVALPATAQRGRCATPIDTATESEQQSTHCQADDLLEILFVGSDAVSARHREEGNCGAHYSGATVVELTRLDDGRPVALEKLLDSAARAALIPAALAAAQGADFADLGTVDTIDRYRDDTIVVARITLLREWGIERGAGRWQLIGHTDCSPYVACGDMTRAFSVPGFTLPTGLIGHDALVPSLAKIRAAVPEVRDAVSSPRRDLLVALDDVTLYVFRPRGDSLGRPVVTLPLSGRIVMAQWAVGRFVPAWTEQLRRLLASP